MAGLWSIIHKHWYERQRQRQNVRAARLADDINLNTLYRDTRRVDSGMALSGLTLVDKEQSSKSKLESSLEHHIYLKLDFGDGVYTKRLDYDTFSGWGAIPKLKTDLEKDGMTIGELWDEDEEMSVCSGDWDARARPGWKVLVHCQNAKRFMGRNGSGCDSDSEDTENGEDSRVDAINDPYYEEWCFPRWREKVEQEASPKMYAEGPSWVVLSLGCVSMVLFIVTVVAYTV